MADCKVNLRIEKQDWVDGAITASATVAAYLTLILPHHTVMVMFDPVVRLIGRFGYRVRLVDA